MDWLDGLTKVTEQVVKYDLAKQQIKNNQLVTPLPQYEPYAQPIAPQKSNNQNIFIALSVGVVALILLLKR